MPRVLRRVIVGTPLQPLAEWLYIRFCPSRSARYDRYVSNPARRIFDLPEELGCEVNLMKRWLREAPPFDRAGFEEQIEGQHNYYLIATPKLAGAWRLANAARRASTAPSRTSRGTVRGSIR